MFFSYKTTHDNLELCQTQIFFNARRTFAYYPMLATEQALDAYLLKNYKITLKVLCFRLINNIRLSTDTDNMIIITFKNKDYDKLAELITYGNSEVRGSDILKVAFGGKRWR